MVTKLQLIYLLITSSLGLAGFLLALIANYRLDKLVSILIKSELKKSETKVQ